MSESWRAAARLEPFSSTDFSTAAHALARDPLASRILGFYASRPAAWEALQSDSRRTFWVVVPGRERVGFVEIEALDAGERGTFTVCIAEGHRGNGFGVAAIGAVIAWSRMNLPVTELATDTESWNAPSIRAMTRSGFSRGGSDGDRVTFRLQL